MAKGKGEVAGWITRNGVHVPIYGNYTVRGGEEPKAKGSKFKGAGKKRKKPDLNAIKGYASDPRTATGDPTVIKVGNEEYFKSGENRWEKHSASGRVLSSSISDEKMNDIVQKHDGEVTVMEGKKKEVSKGHTEEGKGAVKDVEGKKSDNWNVDHVKNDILPSNTSDKEKSDYINFLHNKGKINDSEKAELMNELSSKSATTQQDRPKNFKEGLKQHEGIQQIAEAQNKKVWNGGASNQELYDAADKFAESKNFNKDKVRDAAFSAFNEKWVATQKERAAQKEQESSKVDRKQDAIDYIAKREDVHPSVAKDTYEHMSESERNHVANEAFKSRTGSKANTLKITDEYWKDSNVSTMFPSFNGITSEQTATRVIGDSKFYGKKLNSVEHVSYDNKNHAYIGSQPAYFDDDKAKGDTVYTVRGLDKNGHAGRVYRYNNESEARQKANTLAGLKSTQDSPSAKEAKGSIPTTVSGLRSAYSEATGSEKAAIASELRKKGYSLVGGKWVKGK